MPLEDMFANLQEQAEGKLKEVAGKITGDEALAQEGAVQDFLANATENLEGAKDSVIDKITGTVEGIKEHFNK